MTDGGTTAPCAVPYQARGLGMETKNRAVLRLKAIPWRRVIVDGILLAGMVLVSSRLISN